MISQYFGMVTDTSTRSQASDGEIMQTQATEHTLYLLVYYVCSNVLFLMEPAVVTSPIAIAPYEKLIGLVWFISAFH